MSDDVILKAATLMDGLMAGMFVASCMMEHAAQNLSAQHWIPYHRAKGTVYGPVMPVLFSTTLLVSLVAALLTLRVSRFIATALLLIAGVIMTSVHLPLNKQFQAWSCSQHPDDWADRRRRWRDWNYVRCVFAVSAFSAAVLG